MTVELPGMLGRWQSPGLDVSNSRSSHGALNAYHALLLVHAPAAHQESSSSEPLPLHLTSTRTPLYSQLLAFLTPSAELLLLLSPSLALTKTARPFLALESADDRSGHVSQHHRKTDHIPLISSANLCSCPNVGCQRRLYSTPSNAPSRCCVLIPLPGNI
jgi:hypothetical protein